MWFPCGQQNCLFPDLEYCPGDCPILIEGQEADEERKRMLEANNEFEDYTIE